LAEEEAARAFHSCRRFMILFWSFARGLCALCSWPWPRICFERPDREGFAGSRAPWRAWEQVRTVVRALGLLTVSTAHPLLRAEYAPLGER